MATAPHPTAVTRRERWLVVAGAASLALFYFVFRSENHPIDAVLYALAVEVKDAYPFFHWHHLLYTPLCWLAFQAARAFGFNGDALAPVAAVSAVTGGGAAAFLYLSIRRLAVARPEALLATAGAAFSAAWWYFSGEAEVLSIISFFLAGALFLLFAPRLSSRTAVLLALWLGVGTLFHQVVFLFTPAAFALLTREREKRWRRVFIFCTSYVAVVVAGYVAIPYAYCGVRSPGEWLHWVTFYAQWGDWGHFSWERSGRGIVATLAAVAAGPDAPGMISGLSVKDFLFTYGPAIALAASVLAVVAAELPRLWRQRPLTVIVLAAWFAGFRVFFSWWEPENVEWGIATTMPIWVLFGWAAASARRYRTWGGIIVAALVLVNFSRLIFPATIPGKNDAEAAARAIVRATRPGDTIFVTHIDTMAWIDYVSRHSRFFPKQTFDDPAPGAAAKIERAARRGFPSYTGEGHNVYFTDFEWDNSNLVGRPTAEELRAVFFRMLRGSEPVTAIRFPQSKRVLYRFKHYVEVDVIGVYEAEEIAGGIESVVLPATGKSLTFKAIIPAGGRYVISIQARGTPARKLYPKMELAVGENPARYAFVDSDLWRFYEAEYELPPGETEITVTFKNDYFDAKTGENRDLFVNRLIIYREGWDAEASGPK